MRSIAVASIAAFALSSCSGGGGSNTPTLPAANPAQGPTTYNGPAALTYTWNQSVVTSAQYVGPLSGDGPMTVHVGLRLQNASGLLQYAQDASNPKSPLYRQFLTAQEIGARFGASNSDVAAAAKYFQANGLTFNTWPQQLVGVVHGNRSAMEKAFGVTFGMYQMHGVAFIAPSGGSPHFLQPVPVVSAMLAANVTNATPFIIRFGAGNFVGYSPQQIAHGFDYSGAWSSGYSGSGITVGIIGTGPIDVNPSNGGDVGLYQKTYGEIGQFHLASTGTSVAIVAASPQPASAQNNNTGTAPYDDPSGLATPPPVTAPCGNQLSSVFPTATCNPEDGEAQLDTETVAGLAPKASVKFYLAYNDTDCTTFAGLCPTGALGIQGLFIADDEIQQAIADDTADVLSLSYGQGESTAYNNYFDGSGDGIGPEEFAALATEGIAVFVSSGDTGNEACKNASTGVWLTTPCVSYPASDPSVVAVGGVNIPLDSYGTLTGQITAWADQTSLGGSGSFGNNIGSGGGVSQYFGAQTWQQNVKTPTTSNPPSPQLNGKRGVPDIALDADLFTGPSILFDGNFGGGYGASGGTSAAAPEAAAMWALVLQACRATTGCGNGPSGHSYRLGNPDGLLYQIYSSGAHNLAYNQVFYDVLYGENQANGAGATPGPPITGCCTAGTGYDLVTGLGSPFAGHLIQAVTGAQVP